MRPSADLAKAFQNLIEGLWHSLEFVIEAWNFLSEGAYEQYVTEKTSFTTKSTSYRRSPKSF